MRDKHIVWILVIIFSLAVMAGCGRQTDAPADRQTGVPGGRVITDMAGRQVTLPPVVNKVYSASPVATVLLYTIDPEVLASWSYYMASDETRFILPKYRDLPVVENWTGRDSPGNIEAVLKLKPDVIFVMADLTPANRALADEMQQLIKIPVVVLDRATDKMEQAYLLAGSVLGRERRAAELAAYARDTISGITGKKALLAGRQPVSVYYAEGRRGLETEPRGSWHAEVIEFVGGVNVASADIPSGGKLGRSPVSLEQVLLWDPEVILIGYFRDGESSSFPQIAGDEEWRNVRAVRGRRVYEIPNHPFNWFDRPPSVNRLIGIKWVANLLYPDIYPCDLRAEVQRFYSLFYHYRLSEQETDELLRRAQR
jgi:iron complex transport system substrate-binding protein